jgi:hypothetical protein
MANAITEFMRILILAASLGALLISGCAHRRSATTQSAPTFSPVAPNALPAGSPARQRMIVTPENGFMGKVAKVNAEGRFVVLNFPIGKTPALEHRMQLYRNGLRVAEVKITGPQLDDDIAADLLAGDAEVGDEAREK